MQQVIVEATQTELERQVVVLEPAPRAIRDSLRVSGKLDYRVNLKGEMEVSQLLEKAGRTKPSSTNSMLKLEREEATDDGSLNVLACFCNAKRVRQRSI